MADHPCDKVESVGVGSCSYWNFNNGSEHPSSCNICGTLNYQELPSVRGNENIALRCGYTVIFVKDVRLSMRFYKDAFGLLPKILDEKRQWGELDTGCTTIAFTPLHQGDATLLSGVQEHEHDAYTPAVNVGIGLIIEGCDGEWVEEDKRERVPAVYDRAVDVGAVPVQSPEPKPWGQIVGYVRDPDGVLIQLGRGSHGNSVKGPCIRS